jgi:hypothetical protein
MAGDGQSKLQLAGAMIFDMKSKLIRETIELLSEFVVNSPVTTLTAMKSHLFIVFALLIIDFSCSKPAKEDITAGPGGSVIKEYHSNGKIKTEISVAGNLRQGLTRNFDHQGRILSEVNYINNLREGTATNYYAASGKINSTLQYKNGVKTGDETWFFESGKIYRVSPYVNGEIDGIQKLFYESAQLKAEVPYRKGYPGVGLKEYKKDGTLIGDYPRIIIRKEDHTQTANIILLIISLSNNAQDVKFYQGPLQDGRYLQKNILQLATQNGSTQIDFNISPGARMDQSFVISAKYKTPMGNPLVISKLYRLQAFNAE